MHDNADRSTLVKMLLEHLWIAFRHNRFRSFLVFAGSNLQAIASALRCALRTLGNACGSQDHESGETRFVDWEAAKSHESALTNDGSFGHDVEGRAICVGRVASDLNVREDFVKQHNRGYVEVNAATTTLQPMHGAFVPGENWLGSLVSGHLWCANLWLPACAHLLLVDSHESFGVARL